MNPPKNPTMLEGPADDPLLPFVLAAKAGDSGAERELLLALAPFVLEIARAAHGKQSPRVPELVVETLIATLTALPSFRGEAHVADVVAEIALERAQRRGELSTSDEQIVAGARGRLVHGARTGDGGLVVNLVDRALEDDAAVLVSQFVQKKGVRQQRRLPYALAIAAVLVAGAVIGLLLTRR